MGYRPEYAQILDTSHHQWAETRFYIQNTARCRTPGVRAPRIRQTVWKHIWDPRATRCRTSGVRAQGIRMMFEKRAARCRTSGVLISGTRTPGIRTTLSGTHTPGIRTTLSGTRAPGNTATTETRAAETYNFVLTNYLHTRMTEGTVETYNRVPTTLATTHRFHARHQALRFRHLMEQIQPSSVLGLFNLRPSRAIRAGQQGNG